MTSAKVPPKGRLRLVWHRDPGENITAVGPYSLVLNPNIKEC